MRRSLRKERLWLQEKRWLEDAGFQIKGSASPCDLVVPMCVDTFSDA